MLRQSVITIASSEEMAARFNKPTSLVRGVSAKHVWEQTVEWRVELRIVTD